MLVRVYVLIYTKNVSTFYYKAKKLSGEEREGRQEAADRFDLAGILRSEGFFLLSSEEDKVKTKGADLFYFLGRVPLQEKMVFARNLAVMSSAGVSLVKSLDVLSRQTDNKFWRKTLENMSLSIKKGRTLSQAMGDHPKVFSSLFRSMVKAGETSGKLEESLKLTAEHLERDYDLRRKVRGALIYPAIIILAMAVIGVLMLVYVVPILLATFEELGVKLPFTTKIIVVVSGFLVGHWLLSSVLSVVFVLAAVLTVGSVRGKRVLSAVSLRLPVISEIVVKINSARTSRTLSSLISSGVEIVEALEITEDVVQNVRFKKVLASAREEIQKGNPISKVFIENSNLFPLLVGEMMAVGEETGKLSEMLSRLASFYEDDVSESTKSLSTVVEPVLMIIIGSIVGFFAISMIQPIYSVVGGL